LRIKKTDNTESNTKDTEKLPLGGLIASRGTLSGFGSILFELTKFIDKLAI
jgi:hypothetical protein